MKNMLWAMLAVLLVAIVPFAVAEEQGTTVDSTTETTANTDDDAAEETDEAGEGSRRENLRERREDLRENRQTIRDVRQEEKDAREDIREIRKSRFGDMREQLKTTCKDTRDNEECKQLKDQLKVEAGNHLAEVVQRMLTGLENAKAKIEASGVDATAKANALASIDAQIVVLQAIQTKITALPENPTREEVRALAKELQDAWKNSRRALHIGVGRMVNNRMGGIIEKSEHLATRLEKTLEKLEARGIDTSGIETMVTEFEQFIADARTAHGEATALLATGDLEGAKAKMNEARQKLKDAHAKLKAIVAAIKQTNGGNLGTPRPASNASNATG